MSASSSSSSFALVATSLDEDDSANNLDQFLFQDASYKNQSLHFSIGKAPNQLKCYGFLPIMIQQSRHIAAVFRAATDKNEFVLDCLHQLQNFNMLGQARLDAFHIVWNCINGIVKSKLLNNSDDQLEEQFKYAEKLLQIKKQKDKLPDYSSKIDELAQQWNNLQLQNMPYGVYTPQQWDEAFLVAQEALVFINYFRMRKGEALWAKWFTRLCQVCPFHQANNAVDDKTKHQGQQKLLHFVNNELPQLSTKTMKQEYGILIEYASKYVTLQCRKCNNPLAPSAIEEWKQKYAMRFITDHTMGVQLVCEEHRRLKILTLNPNWRSSLRALQNWLANPGGRNILVKISKNDVAFRMDIIPLDNGENKDKIVTIKYAQPSDLKLIYPLYIRSGGTTILPEDKWANDDTRHQMESALSTVFARFPYTYKNLTTLNLYTQIAGGQVPDEMDSDDSKLDP